MFGKNRHFFLLLIFGLALGLTGCQTACGDRYNPDDPNKPGVVLEKTAMTGNHWGFGR
jgi:hypothetical protein